MSKKKTTRASKTVPSFIRDSGRHVCNDLISRVFRRVRVFLLCAPSRDKKKNALVFPAEKKEQSAKKNKKKFLSFVFSSIFFQTLSSKKLVRFNRDEEGGDEEQTRKKNNNNNNEDVGSREGVLPLY